MFFKPFELRGHRQCPHKTPSNCNTSVIPMSLYKLCPHKPHKPAHTHTHHTHTHTLVFCGLWGLSIGVMVFILYNLYVLLPYTYPTPKLSPHRRTVCIFRFSKKQHLVCFLSLLNYGDIGSVLIKHLQIVIPLSYPCHYTNLCPHKPHKPAHTHTHTHTHTRWFFVGLWDSP